MILGRVQQARLLNGLFAVICQAIKFHSGTQLDGRAEKTQCDGCGSV